MSARKLGTAIALIVACSLTAAACSSSSKAATPASNSTTTTPTTGAGASAAAASVTHVAACTRPHASGQFAQSFQFQGETRTYQLYVPPAYKGTVGVPLVFNFHGFGSDAAEQMVYGNFKPEANQHDFLIVAPDGQATPLGRHFNLSGEKGLQNDITMVQSLLGHIEATLCVDASRVYATGMSDGGAMTSVLACLLPGKFAAFAAVAVIIYCGTKTARPVAIEAFAGTADPVVPYNGGAVHCCGGTVLGSKPVAMAGWAAHDKCNKQFTNTQIASQVQKRTWSGCTAGSAVVFYTIDGGGHTWPGAIPIPSLGPTTQQINASSVIWSFFAAHTLAA